jgi:hypothetical protein
MAVEAADRCALDAAGLEGTCLAGDSVKAYTDNSRCNTDGELPSTCAFACAFSFRTASTHSFLIFSLLRASNASTKQSD